jgi:putative integral membrane protein (TIGR02587 family)
MSQSSQASQATTIEVSIQEYARGVAGGLLFSLPLLYTMEMWEMGLIAEPARLLVGLGFGFLLLLGYNRFAGLRCDASLTEVVIDSVEELGLGLVLAATILWLLGSIDGDTRMPEVMGKVVIEGLAVAIGVSVGTAQLGGESPGVVGDAVKNPYIEHRPVSLTQTLHGPSWFAAQLTLATCGAVLIAANVAPTEEIEDIARGISVFQQFGLTGLTLAIGALVLYLSNFRGSRIHVLYHARMDVLFGALATYLISMLAAAALLWFFGRFDGNGPAFCLAETIVLGLPTAIGASAGRLLLQPQ